MIVQVGEKYVMGCYGELLLIEVGKPHEIAQKILIEASILFLDMLQHQ
ncbi:MAG: hypothetical protein LLG06_02790 [Desulfobacteraceae bacterium]|nr:hypothetical protein [Desulfobacteraceae bacterium]